MDEDDWLAARFALLGVMDLRAAGKADGRETKRWNRLPHRYSPSSWPPAVIVQGHFQILTFVRDPAIVGEPAPVGASYSVTSCVWGAKLRSCSSSVLVNETAEQATAAYPA